MQPFHLFHRINDLTAWLSDLDFAKHPGQKQGKVPSLPAIGYADFRRRALPGAALHEGRPADAPAERLLQSIWFHQRLQRDRLQTADGRRVTVLHPGFWNREAGPDFRDAVIQFDTDAPRSGDIEVDLHSSAWRGHGHDRNAAFHRVILHVTWEPAGSAPIPTLPLQGRLDAPLAELAEVLGGESAQQLPPALAGQCCAPLKELSAETLRELLEQAALCRLQAKAAHLAARARQAGWEQALWEGLFRALGYKHNTWPMQRLGEISAALRMTGPDAAPLLAWQARLLGISGLLPSDWACSSERAGRPDLHLRRLWDIWWRERERFSDVMLPRHVWRIGGLRPANHPQRRLALAAHWLAVNDLPARIEKWFASSLPDKAAPAALLDALQPPADDFWSHHWTLAARMDKPQPLLGGTRATDLAINVILPWLWARADAGGNTALRDLARRRYLAWPPAEDNATLKLARQRLLGGRALPRPATAALQQGLLQIVRDFCDHSNAVCDQCRFPELIGQLARPAG